MRFSEHELTTGVHGAAKSVLASRRDIRKGKVDIEDAWRGLTGAERYHFIAPIGEQVLPVLVALPDVEVEPGDRPTYTDAQIREAVQAQVSDQPKGRVRRAALLAARVHLVKTALAAMPPRSATS